MANRKIEKTLKEKNLKISIMLSLKRDSLNLAKNEQMSSNDYIYNNNSIHTLKRGKTSSSTHSKSQSNIIHKKQEKKNKYRLRVSFQKCSSYNNDLNQSLNRNESHHSTGSRQRSNSEEKFKVYFSKNKSDNLD